MTKKKSSDKDTKRNRRQKDFLKPGIDLSAASLSPETMYELSDLSPETIRSLHISPETMYGLSGLSPETIRSLRISPETMYGLSGLSPQTISIGEDLEDKISELRKENRKLNQEITEKKEALKKKEIKIGELKETVEQLRANEEEMRKQQRLQNLFYRVHPLAWEKLNEDEEFRKLFEQKEPCPAVIMAIDIRKSTELMLKAKDADSYQSFIIALCAQLRQIILDNYGVFDKFTGDGILAFFPEFYSGDDATYLALKAADECHACFSQHYENNRSCFTTILRDVGLGIGIDYGDAHLVNIQDWLTVIGTPVVYACRLSGAPAGQTLVNQQAYDTMSQKFGGYINFQDAELLIKNEGNILVYIATLAKKSRKIKLPAWRTPPISSKS
jgi:class 3 adenylate cyclase